MKKIFKLTKQATVKIKEALAALHRDSLKPEVFHHLFYITYIVIWLFSCLGQQLRRQKCDKMLEIKVQKLHCREFINEICCLYKSF